MKRDNVIILAENYEKKTRNTLLYIISKKEFVVVSNCIMNIKKDTIEWDWGHYFDKLEDAWRCYYEE